MTWKKMTYKTCSVINTYVLFFNNWWKVIKKIIHILILYIYLFYNTISLVDCGHFVRQIKRVNTNNFFNIYFTLPNKLYLHHENLPCKEMHSDYIRIVSQKSTLPKFWQSSLPTGLNSSSPEPTARQRRRWEIQHPELLYLKTIQNNDKKHKNNG